MVSASILMFPRELNTLMKLLYTSIKFFSLYWSNISIGCSLYFL